MASSKKKRGKQRKAAKQQQTAAAETSSSSAPQDTLDTVCYTHPSNQLSTIITRGGGTCILPQHHKLAALYVRRADAAITVVMEELTDEDVTYDGISKPNISLVQSGIVSTVLDFLGRCEQETFDGVMAKAKGDVLVSNGTIASNVGGNLDTPSRY